MEHIRLIQRIFCIDAEKIEAAMEAFPDGFHDGIAVVTFNGIYADDTRVSDFSQYAAFFARMRQTGKPVHVNFSSSIGHTDIQKTVDTPYPTMVGENGNTCQVSACPRSEAFAAHLRKTVSMYASLKPDVFWVDDDFRLSGHEPVVRGCFCDDCVARFGRDTGTALTRESLVRALCRDERIGALHVRAAWQEYNRTAMLSLAKLISDTVHAIDDGIVIGYMQCNPESVLYECPHFEDLIAVSANRNREVWFRHGSGFYDDRRPYDAIAKNFSISRLCAMTESPHGEYRVVNLTEEVTSPYIRREKSMTVTRLEAAMNIGIAGADGIMDEGIKPNLSEQLLPGHLVDEMHRSYRWLDTLYRLRQGKKQVGICPFFDRDLWKYNDPVSSLGQMTDLGSRFFMNLFCLGLSLTTRTEDADVMLLSGKTVRAMAPGQLRRWLGRGVYLDGTAALEVNRILAGDGICYTGVRGADYDPAALTGAHTSERFTDHPLNGADAGYLRYNIWGGSRDGEACLTADGAEILTYSMCPAEAEAGIVGMTFFENEIGGRTAVVSRGAWCPDILGEAKGRQIRRVMAALAGGALPCLLDAPTRCGISVWKSPHDRERAVYIYNTDFDAAEGVCLYTDRPFSAALIAADGSEVPLTAEPASQIALPVLPAWSCTAMVLRDET